MAPDIQKIIHIAQTAGKNILLPGFKQQAATSIKDDGSVVTETDLKCQDFLQRELSTLAPNIAFLGEEMTQHEQLKCLQSNKAFWCVDPLDGTSNFATPIPLFAISIALIDQGKPILACIHDPIRQETFTAIRGQGFQLNGQPMQSKPIAQLIQAVGFIDFKRLDTKTASRFATQKVYRSQRNIGSCALEWAWLAAGRGQFIIHGSEKLWDYAAGCLLAEESGCKVTDFGGNHPFKHAQLSSPIAAAPASIHKQLLSSLIL
ncbi:MAG: inositol monophosphatase [Proteobacteria bacterium]|nr:MAG: inositol monophosphatase [Pseudomonadota bacterium]